MNPVLFLLIIIFAIALWFIISFIFTPLGNAVLKKWDKTLEILNRETKNDEEEEKYYE